jgi:hypothetical protein
MRNAYIILGRKHEEKGSSGEGEYKIKMWSV